MILFWGLRHWWQSFTSLFQVEARIYDAIDDLHESLSKRIAENEFNFGVHVAAYAERKERVDYLIHANEEKIDHKANRLLDEIKAD